MNRLTGAQTKYLHVIYKAQDNDGGIRSIDIARELGVSKASVSRMVKLLADRGLISGAKQGGIRLTRKGKHESAMIHDKVTRIYPFFADYLELERPEALNSTYPFLCGFSEACIEQLVGKGWAPGGTPA